MMPGATALTLIPCLSDNSFGLLAYPEGVRLAAMLGFSRFRYRGDRRQHAAPPLKDLRGSAAEKVDSLSGEVRAAAFTVSDIVLVPSLDFSELAPNHPDPTERAKSRRLFADGASSSAFRLGDPIRAFWLSIPTAITSCVSRSRPLSYDAGRSRQRYWCWMPTYSSEPEAACN